MARYMIGDYIYELRKQRGLTQEELAEGICTTGTLSRIENGSRTPSSGTYEALMQRLGASTGLFTHYVGRRELEADNYCRKILNMMACGNHECLDVMIEEYFRMTERYRLAKSQPMLYMRAIYRTASGEEPGLILQELYPALKQPKMAAKEWLRDKRRLLTFHEIVIWNTIAVQYKRMGDHPGAFAVWDGLVRYIEKREMDAEEYAKTAPMLYYNLASLYKKSGMPEQTLIFSERGIRVCIEYGKLFPLGYLLTQKAGALAKLGCRKEAEEISGQAAVLFEIIKQEQEPEKDEMLLSL